jgi:hypothetical protein
MECLEETLAAATLGACDGNLCWLAWPTGSGRDGESILYRLVLERAGVARPPDAGSGRAPPGRAIRLERKSER